MVFQHLFHKPSVAEVSAEEAKAKQQAGFAQVSSMAGGMTSWMRHHFPVSYT